MSGEPRSGRTFLLIAGFLGGVAGGWWLGLVAAILAGIAPSDPPLFPGEYLIAAVLAASLITVFAALVAEKDRDGRQVALILLLTAAFAALDVLCALYLLTPLDTLCILPSPDEGPSANSGVMLVTLQDGLPPQCRPSPPATSSPLFWAVLSPAALVATLLCSAAVRRSAILQLAGVAAGGLFTLAGLSLSLVRAVT